MTLVLTSFIAIPLLIATHISSPSSTLPRSNLDVLTYVAIALVPTNPLNVNASHKAPEGPHSIVLPICEECMDKGLHIIVRAARQNAEAKQARLNSQAAREALRQEKAAEEAFPRNVASSSAEPSPPTQFQGTRKRRAVAPPASRRTRSNSNKRGKRV